MMDSVLRDDEENQRSSNICIWLAQLPVYRLNLVCFVSILLASCSEMFPLQTNLSVSIFHKICDR